MDAWPAFGWPLHTPLAWNSCARRSTSSLWPELERAMLRVDLQAAAVRSRLYAEHRVRAERVREDGGWEIEVEVTPRQLEALAREARHQPCARRQFLCA